MALQISEATQTLNDSANKTGEPARKRAKWDLLQAEFSRLPSRQTTRTTAQATKAKLQQQVLLCSACATSEKASR